MINTIQNNIYKITLLLLIGCCLGLSGRLYGVQHDKVDEKEDVGPNGQHAPPNAPNHKVDREQALMPAWNGNLSTYSAFQIYLLLDKLVLPAILASAKKGTREGLERNRHKILQYVLSRT